MASFTPAELADAATIVADETAEAVRKAGGRIVNGITVLAEDKSVADDKKVNFLNAIADLFNRGVQATVATLTGQPDARLALEGGTSTPDPVTAPVPTPADAERNAKVAKFDAVIQWIGANGGNVVAGEDIKVTLDRLLTTKVEAAKTMPADMVKKVDAKPFYEDLDKALEDQHWEDTPIRKRKSTKDDNLQELKKVRDGLKTFLGIS